MTNDMHITILHAITLTYYEGILTYGHVTKLRVGLRNCGK